MLEAKAIITGRVVDPNGQPIQDAYLDLETLLPNGSGHYFIHGDDPFYRLSLEQDGRFVFTEVSIGLPGYGQ